MRRDLTTVIVLWAVVSVFSVAVAAFLMDPFPAVGAEEAEFIDHAFMVMTYMGAPVFAIVISVLLLALWRWRTPGAPSGDEDDGPPIQGTNWFPKAWLGATSALAVVIMIYPGLTGLAELRKDDTAEMRVEVTGVSWQWLVSYPDNSDIRLSSSGGDEMVLPADTRIQFDVKALDIVHSFWVPAFRQKIDAVPGQTTVMYTTVTDAGDYDDDVAYRIQCAELCGLNHTDMAMKVRVVERDEFDEWVASKSASAAKVN